MVEINEFWVAYVCTLQVHLISLPAIHMKYVRSKHTVCIRSSRLPHTNSYTKVAIMYRTVAKVHNDVIQMLPVYMELHARTKTEIQIIKTYTDRIRACAVYSSTLRLTKASWEALVQDGSIRNTDTHSTITITSEGGSLHEIIKELKLAFNPNSKIIYNIHT